MDLNFRVRSGLKRVSGNETGELLARFSARLVVSEFGQTKVALGDVLAILLTQQPHRGSPVVSAEDVDDRAIRKLSELKFGNGGQSPR